MEEARGVTVEFKATLAKFDKAAGKPGKVVLEVGDQHAAAILGLVGERVLVTLEGSQTVIPDDGPGEGQESIFSVGVSDEERSRRVEAARKAGADPDTGEELEPECGSLRICQLVEAVPSCPLRTEADEHGDARCSHFLSTDSVTVDDCKAAAMPVLEPEPEPEVEGEEIPSFEPVIPQDEVPFIPTEDDEEAPIFADEEGEDLEAVGDALFDEATVVEKEGAPERGTIASVEVTQLLRKVAENGRGMSTLPGGGPAYQLERDVNGTLTLTIRGGSQDNADADAAKIGVQAGVTFSALSVKPASEEYTYSSAVA